MVSSLGSSEISPISSPPARERVLPAGYESVAESTVSFSIGRVSYETCDSPAARQDFGVAKPIRLVECICEIRASFCVHVTMVCDKWHGSLMMVVFVGEITKRRV